MSICWTCNSWQSTLTWRYDNHIIALFKNGEGKKRNNNKIVKHRESRVWNAESAFHTIIYVLLMSWLFLQSNTSCTDLKVNLTSLKAIKVIILPREFPPIYFASLCLCSWPDVCFTALFSLYLTWSIVQVFLCKGGRLPAVYQQWCFILQFKVNVHPSWQTCADTAHISVHTEMVRVCSYPDDNLAASPKSTATYAP